MTTFSCCFLFIKDIFFFRCTVNNLFRIAALVIFTFFNFTYVRAQNSYPQLQNISLPNPAPLSPGDVFTPPMSGLANSNSPVCAEWTRTAGPDESLVITGINFSKYKGSGEGKDSRFTTYAGSGFAKEAIIQRLDDQKAVITLDKNISKWSMYLVWPSNEYGYGYPITINETDAWWIGPEKATRASVISLYGRNLAHNNDTVSSNIYIKASNGNGQWAVITKVNPYKVDFIVPSNLSNGEYEVWAHNGHGGQYGWSGPLKLSIFDAPVWNASIFNVVNYGAVGNGITDNTQAIQSAIAAAAQNPGSTVYFPKGIYIINNTIWAASDMKIKGDSRDNTIIKCGSGFSDQASGMFTGSITNFQLENIGFDTNGNLKGEYSNPISLRGSSYVNIQDIRLSCQGFDIINLDRCYRIIMKNCELIGKISFLGSASQIFIDSCQFRLTNDAELAVHSWGGVGVSLTNSTCEDYDNTNINDGAGWGKGRFFVGNGNSGSSRFTYIGNNTTKDLAVRDISSVDQNSGEQILWEGFTTDWSGFPVSSTASTTALANFADAYSSIHYAVVIKGRGLGQSRRILSYSGNTIVLESPWNLTPDAKSAIVVGRYADRTVVYKNFLDGKAYSVSSINANASSGIEPYGGTLNFIADNNTCHEVRSGIANCTTQLDIGIDPNYFSLYTENRLIKCKWGISNQLASTRSLGTALLGSTYRNNFADSIDQAGITNNLYNQDSVILDAFIYEHNYFKSVRNGFSAGGDTSLPWFSSNGSGVKNQILYKNNFSGQSSTSTFGIKTTSKLALQQNLYTGFATDYQNTMTDTIIEAPYHVVNISGNIHAGMVDTSFVLYNSGTSVMNWKASSNASWLTIPSNSGSIQDETAHSNIILRASPTGLTAGTHTAYITISAGSFCKMYSILFKVSDDAALPVTITSIRAYQKEHGISVDWTTEYEKDIDSYEVEKSLDARQFIKAGTVQPKAVDALMNHYSWFDANPKQGNNYYRIKIIDHSGTIKYTGIVNVKMSGGKSSFDVYPNPVTGNYSTVQFNNVSKGIYILQLLDNSGQVIFRNTINHPGGSASQIFSISANLPAGTYNLQVTGNGTSFITQLLK